MLIKEILGQAHVILVPQNRECEGLLREWNGGYQVCAQKGTGCV
ncbi:hypothetical protein AALD74_04545 [Lachnospiraceae bacterium 48-21]